jgi:ketosteroid isomerase-like protein
MILNKRIALALAAAGFAAGLASCAKPPPTVDVAKETDAINAEDAAINAAFKAKDADKAVAYDADDVTSWAPGSPPITSKVEDLASTKASFLDPGYSFSFAAGHTEIAKAGDLAYQTGSFNMTATNPATHKVEAMSGNWVAAFKKADDGTWKIAAVAATPGAAASAAPAAANAAAPATNSP